MNVTTKHTQIGYTENIAIIETALREKFGFDDQSHVLRAVAAHIWSVVCGSGEDKTWGDPEIVLAVIACQKRLQAMLDKMACQVKGCAISYPHVRHQHGTPARQPASTTGTPGPISPAQ